jgi:hypothetical protein
MLFSQKSVNYTRCKTEFAGAKKGEAWTLTWRYILCLCICSDDFSVFTEMNVTKCDPRIVVDEQHLGGIVMAFR